MTQHEPPPASGDSRPVYTGLSWAPARDRRLIARSDATPASYIVDAIIRLEKLDREFYMDLSRGFGQMP